MAAPPPLIHLTTSEVIAFNHAILRRAGQSPAPPRDRGLLESALQRPQTAAHYESADVLTQAALHMVGIALNHPFVDGNKRTGYIAGMSFLHLNQAITITAGLNDIQMAVWLEQAVTRQLTFAAFVAHLRLRLAPSQP